MMATDKDESYATGCFFIVSLANDLVSGTEEHETSISVALESTVFHSNHAPSSTTSCTDRRLHRPSLPLPFKQSIGAPFG